MPDVAETLLVLGSIHNGDFLGVNYWVNYLHNYGLFCTKGSNHTCDFLGVNYCMNYSHNYELHFNHNSLENCRCECTYVLLLCKQFMQ